MSRFVRKAAVGVLAAVGALAVAAAPAAAAEYPTDEFSLCGVSCTEDNVDGYTSGVITWYNRTANIQGSVTDIEAGPVPTTVYFEAYAGSTKIDSESRTANDASDLGQIRDFNFTIGDTDLVGGIDRIKITLCQQRPSGIACTPPENYSKA
ncbi:hypothetical protein [Streptomyces cupreus]|uniref:Secreted protein n=1 Tax=Streptomyces cupreus TaxID=2759956 RepID=A0A7X1J3L0_9ACTN|nr:hypothetical protein [Streptomyces cupreus]MBC2903588.1 hypothetical protein [Streptomyces cupreus]